MAERVDFTSLYQQWYPEVKGWLRAFGVPDSETDDLAQEVFMVVRRNLERFDGRNLFGWLYKISQQTASDQRRRGWFRKLFLRPRNVPLDQIEDLKRTPIEQLEGKEAERLVRHVVAQMSPKKRVAFVLFELEGYSGDEIAALEGIPVATVWTRIHHAHKEFARILSDLEEAEVA